MSKQIFFGWDTPWLPRLAETLLTSWAHEGERPLGDLSETIVILPARRAGRRLLQLLALKATAERLILLPPRIMTLREAIPFLLPLEKKRNEAGSLSRHLAWSETLEQLTEEEWETLQANAPFAKRETHFIGFIEQLADHLGMQGVSFHRILARIGVLYPESAEREEARWKTLAELQKKYRARLHAWDFIDPYEALERHLTEGKASSSYRVLIAGVIDAPKSFAPFFEKVNPSIFIIAPREHAAGFDAHGTLLSAYWLAYPPALKESQLLPCHRNEDQSEVLLSLLRSCKAPPSDFVTIVAEAEALPTLRDRLERASFQLHWAGGLPFYQERLYQLLKAVAEFLHQKDFRAPSYQAIGALLRHPDVGRHLSQSEELLKQLDEDAQEHPSSTPDTKSFLPLLELEKIIRLPSSPAPLAHCIGELKIFLLRLLGEEVVSRGSPEGHCLVESLKTLLEYLEQFEDLCEKTPHLWSMVEVIDLLLQVLAFETIPEPEEPDALECVGWLELMADDAPCTIVTSCHEGFLPRTPPKHPLLPERLCKAFQLGDSTTLLARDFYLLHLINNSSELKIIAPCVNARGEFVRPSRLLTLGCSQKELPHRVLSLLHPASQKEKPLITALSTLQGRPLGNRFLAEPAEGVQGQGASARRPAVYRDILEDASTEATPPFASAVGLCKNSNESIDCVTVMGLRTYLASPRLFYLQHVLKLKEVLPLPLEMGASHFGTLLHAVLGCFGKEHSLVDVTEEKLLATWLKKKLFSLAALHFGPNFSPLLLLQLQEAVKSLASFAKIQGEHRRSGWKIIAVENALEEKVMLADGRSLFLQGRVDRIDWHPEKQRWLLIDYKTSNRQQWERATPDAEHYHKQGEAIIWKDLQLPLYLKLAPRSQSIQQSGLPTPTPDNTDLRFCQLPLEYERARFSPSFSPTMILPAWKEAERLLARILDRDFEEIGTIDAARMPTFAALCGITK